MTIRTNATQRTPDAHPASRPAAAKPTPAAQPAPKPAAMAAAQGLKAGTGPLGAVDGASTDALLDQALGAIAAGKAPAHGPKSAKPKPFEAAYPNVWKALKSDPAAVQVMKNYLGEMLMHRDYDSNGPTAAAQLEAAAKEGKGALVHDLVMTLSNPDGIKAPGDAAEATGQLALLARTAPAAYTAAMLNLSRNGFGELPGGEKIVMQVGDAAGFWPRLAASAKLVSPQQTAVEAIAALRPIFYTRKANWEVVKASSDRRIESDAKDVNSLGDGVAYRGQIRRNAEAEKAALAALSPADREAYQTVAKAVDGQGAWALSWQALLLEGKLPGKAASADGKTLLAQFEALAKAPLHSELKRDRLLGDLIQEVQRPDAINQDNHASCTMTSVQIKLALENPAELVRLVTGLASPEGDVKLANGDTLKRNPGTEKPDTSYRTDSARLFQAAMMDFADGDLDYDNSMTNQAFLAKYREREGLKPDAKVEPQDLHSDGSGGLGVEQVHRALQALSGGQFTSLSCEFPEDPAIKKVTEDELIQRLKDAVDLGLAVPVGMQWGGRDAYGKVHGGHEVLVTGIKGGRVYYDNPWGQQESMAIDRFKARADEISVGSFAELGQPAN